MVLLAILFFMFFWYTNQQQQSLAIQQKHIADSTQKANDAKIKPIDKAAAFTDSLHRDSLSKTEAAGTFLQAANGNETFTVVESDLLKATFSNKGGVLKSVDLKKYKSFDSVQVTLSGNKNDKLAYTINTAANQSAETSELFFGAAQIIKNGDSTQTISYTLSDSAGRSITHQYIIRTGQYLIDWNIVMNGADKLLSNGALNIKWHQSPMRHQSSIEYERQLSNVCFSVNNEFDYISSKTEATFEEPAQWVSNVQQFFNTTLIAKNSFSTGSVKWGRREDTGNVIADVDVSLQMKVPATASVTIPMQLFYGPNDYEALAAAAPEMDKIVNLGRDLYSFVRPINKYIILPVFNFFASFIPSYGWVIALLTLLIRGVTSPLTYKSYLSGAKMRVLKPELDGLKKKFGTDQQGFAMEQMKLFREAGVNPLGGCMPALLQIPIFFALYSFFSSNISLRGESFLWVKDLSSYDILAKLPFTIPGFGDHISFFTLTAVATSFVISIYNMSMTPTQDNPAMKYMPYIFPFVLLFVFNKLPSALTWYYTVSNIITLGIQFVIQNYIINHDKILAQIDAKRKAPKKVSKFQEKYVQVMETQKKVQELKNKGGKK